MNKQLLTEIEKLIESLIHKYLSGWEPSTMQPLEQIFPKERRIQSIMHGLFTSFGTTLWEELAKKLARDNGFIVLNEKEFMKQEKYPKKLETILSRWVKKREDSKKEIPLSGYISELKKKVSTLPYQTYSTISLTSGEGIDVWLKKDNIEYAFDIKTVQINKGSGLKFNKTLMNWYAYRTLSDPNLEFKAYIAFPYNPYTPLSWWSKNGGRAKPLIENEDVLIENYFWDFLSGEKNTWALINQAFKNVGKKNLAKKYKKTFSPKKKSKKPLQRDFLKIKRLSS